MAGILDTLYLVVAVIVTLIGLGLVTRTMTNSEASGGSRWIELAAIAVAAVFVLALGVELIV